MFLDDLVEIVDKACKARLNNASDSGNPLLILFGPAGKVLQLLVALEKIETFHRRISMAGAGAKVGQ